MPAEEDLYDFIANDILRLFVTSNLKDTELLVLNSISYQASSVNPKKYTWCAPCCGLVLDHRTRIFMTYLTGAQSMPAK